ncbi:MAG: hypothetical protein CSB13_09630 [Chloroflexi bacterium]|nr:MAG: hypothetical protein CSB13_09630 [Chloroflexota bacterium]
MLLAGVITALVPNEVMAAHLGGGLGSMLTMLAIGVPLYICATASTPVAAALVVKGVSPGTALVFLLVGPATNITSLTVLIKVLGKKGTVIYLLAIALFAVVAGFLVDSVYLALGISAAAAVGNASEMIPDPVRWLGALLLVGLSIGPISRWVRKKFTGEKNSHHGSCCAGSCSSEPLTSGHNHDHAHHQSPHLLSPQPNASCDGGHSCSPEMKLINKNLS